MSRSVRFLAIAALVIFVLVLASAVLEVGLRVAMGFGTPVLYDNTYATGFRPLPNQDLRRTGGKRIRFNNLGMRARRDWPPDRPQGQLRLLYLGDSITYGGSYVDDRETFVEVCAETLGLRLGRDVLAGNAAVNGWGPKNIQGLVDRFGCFGADLVVVVALGANLDRGFTHMAETPFWNHRPSSAIEEVLSSYVAYTFGTRRFLSKDHFVSGAERDSVCLHCIGEYTAIGGHARDSGAGVLMVWHPSLDAARGQDPDKFREAFLSACRDAGLPTLDLSPVVRSQRDPARFYVDPIHLSPAGHAIYGAAMAPALERMLRASFSTGS